MTTGGAVRVAVLGPVEAGDDAGSEVALTPQLRRLLGVFVAAGGRPVSVDRLAEYAADGRAEGSTVRTAVSRLRKVLDDRIESVDGGYRLVLGPDELDVARFEQLVARARTESGEVRIAALTRALELWRGRPFGDLADEVWASAPAARWEGLRASVVEDLAEESSAAGRHRDAVELLEPHVREHPYRERPVELLMRALAADGRVADGVRLFERFRVTLRDDLGLDPSAELRAVESELLAASDSPTDGSSPSLPSGTVTFLFTDIEGSTERWAADEAAMTSALAAHDAVLRSEVTGHAGVVFKHTGDGVCAVFGSASAAVDAALAAQARLDLPVRMGLHTGEAELRDGDYFGPTLNRVARIMDAGHGGQVLLSRATAALVPDVVTADLGERRLKGLSSPERIFQIGTDDFPALRVATARKGNLPNEPTEFVGRDAELADVVDRLVDQRMVTLLGVGGVGKTRLAVETAHAVAPRFPDGCWLVELARVVVPEAVPHAVCIGLGLQVPEQGDVTEHIVSRLRHQRLAVVLDNCEHVLDAAATIAETILADCPAVTIVATSREPLMVAGEHLVPTASLSAADATALFVDRLGAEAPSVVVDDRQRHSIAAICERLDGLPLAIELAASRARSMSPAEIEARLDERFRLLVGGRRSRMERHQTMRGTVDWSYELCSPTERHVFDRLSVFAGEFDAAGAVGVAVDDDHERFDVEDALHRLVDRSLVQLVIRADGASRYRLLETMRAYGRERLADSGASDEARRRHAEHVASALAALSLQALGPDELRIHERIRELTADLVVAVDWCIEQEHWHLVPKLCAAGTAFAAPGIAFNVIDRVDARLPPMDEAIEGLEPLLHLGLAAFGNVTDRGDRDRIVSERFVELVSSGATMPVDAVYLVPITQSTDVPDRMDEAVANFLDGLDEAPAPVRWYATFVATLSMVNRDSQWLQPTFDDFAQLTVQVGGDLARRRYLAQVALLHEIQGDLDAAEPLLLEALPESVGNWGDVLVAMRVLRVAARRRGRVSGLELRRPIEWMLEITSSALAPSVLASCAIALEAAGRAEPARRVAAAVASTGAGEFFADLLSVGAPEFARLFREADPSSGPSPEQAIAELLALADELETSH